MVISSGSCPEGCRFESCLRNVIPEDLVVKPDNWNCGWSNKTIVGLRPTASSVGAAFEGVSCVP